MLFVVPSPTPTPLPPSTTTLNNNNNNNNTLMNMNDMDTGGTTTTTTMKLSSSRQQRNFPLRSNPQPQEIIDSDDTVDDDDDSHDDDFSSHDNNDIEEEKVQAAAVIGEEEYEDSSTSGMNMNMSMSMSKNNNLKDKKDLDALLAKELNSLTIKERENVFETIHGVDPTIEETPFLIKQSLAKLQIEIDKLPLKKKQAYIMALSMEGQQQNSSSYIKTTKFRLMFLRCDNFIPSKAAKRFVLYFERLLEYFGPHVLNRELHISDLSPEAIDYLKLGHRQVLSTKAIKDSSGRAIFFDHYLLAEKLTNIQPLAMIQTYIYLFYSAVIDDELTQKRGIVFVVYIVGDMTNGFDSYTYGKISDIQYWLPFKISAHHILFNSPTFHVWAPLAWIVMGKDMRKRVRMHDGTHLECMYALQSFGIPVDKLPVDYDGNIKLQLHHEWIQSQQQQKLVTYYQDIVDDEIDDQQQQQQQDDDDDVEMKPQHHQQFQPRTATASANNNNDNNNTEEQLIEKLERQDVALWRGRVYQRHPGNIKMRQLIDKYRDEYDKAVKGIKADIAMKIVSEIASSGGRFLIKDSTGNWWIEVDHSFAQKKVSKAFRSARKPPASSSSTQSSSSSTIITKIKTGKDGNKRLRVESPPLSSIQPPSILSTTAFASMTTNHSSSNIARFNNNNNSNRAAAFFIGDGGGGNSSDDNSTNNPSNFGCIFPRFTTSFNNNNSNGNNTFFS